MDESEAIALLQQGDISGLEVLVRTYQTQAMRAAYLITGDAAAAEDIVQEAFLRAYERIDQFDSARPFAPWFLRSVVNDAVKAATRRRRLVPWHGEDDAGEESPGPKALAIDPNPGPEARLELTELADAVGEALERLSPSRRAAIVLRYYLDLSEPEIAGRMRWPLGTVKRRLHDARRHLRSLLAAARAPGADRGEARRQMGAGRGHSASATQEGGTP